MPNDRYRNLLFRTFTALGVVLAFFLTLVIPQHMHESNDWSFQYATQNFSHGQFATDGATIGSEQAEAYKYGGLIDQYVQIGDNRWALTEAPGYIFYLLPFYYINAPGLANFFLASGMALVAYLLLKRLRDEKTACLGALLMLFTPVALAMLQRQYIDGFGSAAFLSMGGGLYVYYQLRRRELSSRISSLLLTLSGLGLGMAVFSNYYNALPAAVFVLHFVHTFVTSWFGGKRGEALRAAVLPVFGLAVPIAALLIYQNAVFGSPFRFGFQYNQLPVSFGLNFIDGNVRYVTAALLAGFPLLLPGLAGFLTAVYQKITACISSHKTGPVGDNWPELRWDLLLLLAGWTLAVFALFYTYEWTAITTIRNMPFIVIVRYYLPAVLPLTLMAVLLLSRLPRKLSGSIVAFAAVWGLVFFAQSALSVALVPPKSPYNPTSALPENVPAELQMFSIDAPHADAPQAGL